MKTFLTITMTVILLFLSSCEQIDTTDQYLDLSYELFIMETDVSFGSASALIQDDFTLEDMLVYAIQDEYAARAEYEYILANFDVTKPFSNIIEAEVTHINLLLPLFDIYEFMIPEDTSDQHLIEIESLIDTFETGVVAEQLNIAMYNLFLEQPDLPDDVIDTFIKLRDASINHLAAFQRQLDK
ncbi:MAG: DUF2202 domain-containing protein [Acholeplasmataceae bacterium]|nr:DUF2202 domain-containing protein [Acholeplasmataceae bacterium]